MSRETRDTYCKVDANMAATKKVAAGAGAGAGVKRKGTGAGVTAPATTSATAAAVRSATVTTAAAAGRSLNLKETARCLQLASDRLEFAGTKNTSSAFSQISSAQEALRTAVDRLDVVCRAGAAERSSNSGLEPELGLGLLLPHVSGLRKTAMRVLLGKVAHIRPEEASNGVLLDCCRISVVGCMVFLVRFLESGGGVEREKGKDKGDGIAAGRLVGTFMESAIFCVKGWITTAGAAAEGEGGANCRIWKSALDEMRLFVLRLRERALRGMEGKQKEEGRVRELDVLLVKISHLYTAAFMRRKAADDNLDQITISFLAHSIAAVKRSPREIKDQASYATKLEKLGAIHENSNRLAEASTFYDDAVNHQLEIGALTLANEAPSNKSSAQVLGPGGKAEILGRALWGYVRVLTKAARSNNNSISWWDNEERPDEERGLMLEWQLEYLCNHLEIDRDRVEIAIKGAVKLLSNIYKPEGFHLRRKQLMVAVFQIKDADLGVYDEELESLGLDDVIYTSSKINELDLAPLDAHYTATILAFQALKSTPDINILEQALKIWENFVEALEESDENKERIDNFSLWITQLKAMSDFFDMKGTDDLRVRSLEVLAKSLQLHRPVDENLLVSTLCKLGHQFLKSGSSGQAGMILGKAQKLFKSPTLATATKLEWNLAYAEYLLSIGNQEKW